MEVIRAKQGTVVCTNKLFMSAMSDLGPNLARLAPNVTNLETF